MSEVGLKLKKLGELVEIHNNKRIPLSSKERANLSKIYPYYGAQGIVDYVDNYIFDGKNILIAEDGENLKSNNKSICTLATGKYWVNNHAHIVRANNENDTDYLFYKLNSISFLPYITGSAQPKLNKENLLNIPVYVHEKAEQKNISKLLSKIDQKIALNNQINQELEAMAKTLYDYWFVQFDFPDENGKPYKSSGGKMVYNDQLKREIPEGWGVKRLGEICNPTSGYPFASNTYVQDGKFKIYTIKNVQDNGILPITDNTLDTLPANLPEKCILGPGDMLMSLTGNVGRVGIVFEDNALLNQRVLKIESKYKAFIFQFLKDPRTRSLLENTATGTSQKNLSPKDVMDISIIFPGFNVLIEFEQISNEILLQITSNNQQNQELTQLRDWLLPMLMNGQVRVEDKTWKL